MLEYTQAEYARYRNVSRQAVNKLIQSGRIPYREKGGRKLIDVAAADRAIGGNRERVNARDDAPTRDAGEAGGYAPAAGETAGLTKARTATEVYRARIAQLEYEERVGKLLRVADVEDAMTRCAETLARDLDGLVGAADDLAAAIGRGGVAELRDELKRTVRALRSRLAESMTLATTADDDDED